MIDKLTPEQEAMIPKIRDEWMAKGLSTTPINRKQAEKDFTEFQSKILGRDPAPVVFVDGPIHAWRLVLMAAGLGKLKDKQIDKFIENIPDFKPSKEDAEITPIWPYWDGQFWASYFAFYDVMEYLGVKLEENYAVLRRCAVGVCWPLDNLCIVADAPKAIHMVNNQLHKDEAPAIEYGDGLKVFALNGVTMKEEHVMVRAEELDPKIVLNESNVEVRRELLRKIGMERFLQAAKHKVIDKAEWCGMEYELISIDLSNEARDTRWLKMSNPSIKAFHVEAVPPNIGTVQAAHDYRANKKNWNPEIVT